MRANRLGRELLVEAEIYPWYHYIFGIEIYKYRLYIVDQDLYQYIRIRENDLRFPRSGAELIQILRMLPSSVNFGEIHLFKGLLNTLTRRHRADGAPLVS